MSYTCRYLMFGNNQERVPGYEDDLILSNKPNVPIPKKLVDPSTDTLWCLTFSFGSGGFYTAGANVPAHDDALIKSWYAQCKVTGPHSLTLTPFIIGEPGNEGFIQVSNFVDFSEPPTTDNSVNTDTIKNLTVTATVHQELPGYEELEVSTISTSHSVIITIKTTRLVFDRIFVYAGECMPIGNTLTVSKGQSCHSLAIFKKATSTSSKEIGTIHLPGIPKWEWPVVIAEIVKNIAVKGNGEIFEYLSPKVIAETDPETLKKAVASISKRIEALDNVKSIITGLADRKGK